MEVTVEKGKLGTGRWAGNKKRDIHRQRKKPLSMELENL